MPFEVNWTFPCKVLRVVDGDTVDVVIDCGFKATRVERIRLMLPGGGYVNAPEIRGPEKPAGQTSTRFVSEWVAGNGSGDWPFVITTQKTDVFGRYLGDLRRKSDMTSLAEALVAAGLATTEKRHD